MNNVVSSVQSLGTILSLWAHPDDETFCCAGIMATAVQNGQKVVCVTATRGEAGVQNAEKWPPETLGQTRAAELQAALRVIGIEDHHWLEYADGDCSSVKEEEAVNNILGIASQSPPDTILTFGADGMTGHPDHQTVSRWATLVAGRLEKRPVIYHAVEIRENYEKYLKQADEKLNIYFNIDKPPLKEPQECDLFVNLSDELQKQKCEMLRCMPSQTEVMINTFGEDFLCAALCCEGFVRAQ